ncbi:alpha-galactosidase [Isoptericola variabilis]|uniref:Alpha-galactosidase n=1 Tax=Isoptericola variabilis (strain 225) TaxID=743718 RepID=F6FS39_ISOV2|nr:alpha-galactosidase [Isoptericola variabilis]AEG45136.1 Alpha-galactosidase [Isoptericola variabilis 225]TWH31428.1 alpha-galactosidase [Isoptericola variabilis J7]
MQHSGVLHLRNGGTSVVLDARDVPLPAIVWWGADLGDLADAELEDLAMAARPQRVSGGIDTPTALALLPQEATGWFGTPGLAGHRPGGRGFSALLCTRDLDVAEHAGQLTGVVVRAADDAAGLAADLEVEVTPAGLVRQRVTLTNLGDEPFELHALAPVFPLPAGADELLDTTGRHLRERSPQRHAFTVGTHVRESRRGRPGADASLLLVAGRAGFGFERGLVHGVHVAWSGNHRLLAERTPTAEAYLSAGELLAPGEVTLAPGASYRTPWAIGSWGDGLDALARRFHDELRARPHHPHRPRPVTLNTWEAVYFDQSLERLTALAERAAAVGVERFVLDDGWFRGRRDDTAGLGDWYVDETVWPDGLGPLIDVVRGHGMEFGLWVEPEMVNPDSDLARAHPDWILRGRADLPVPARQQQVLDLSRPDVRAYLLERLDALLTEHDIAYLKWDHNRDLLEAGSAEDGRARVHENVKALYALLAELKRRHPGLEIESCASGGARVDLGILEHTDRVWTSDTLDPVERLQIQRYTGLLVPPELMGAHLTTPHVHSTGRTVALDLSAGVALPGHFGIEWDLTTLDDAGLADVAQWVALHRRYRDLLHTGVVVNADTPPDRDVRGVVARERDRAVITYTQVTTSVTYPPGRFTVPGLDPERRYAVRVVAGSVADGPGQSPLPWTQRPVTLTGRQLGLVGLQAPVLHPGRLVVLELTAQS